ncbi:hypothetical protein EJ02DRAFT_219494 [Clathrospora elynae]|uniref:Uncharacterized protein n=1 Tax=Clathrospora elynae TaxID=706981 RepID=A0A6A5SLZ9_9PLEO|nr:hypothetical protein EJ02DRAFT_219494 [Clathrospora elynae]
MHSARSKAAKAARARVINDNMDPISPLSDIPSDVEFEIQEYMDPISPLSDIPSDVEFEIQEDMDPISPLSDIPSDVEFEIQEEINTRRLEREQARAQEEQASHQDIHMEDDDQDGKRPLFSLTKTPLT